MSTCWLCSVHMSNCLTCSGSLSNSTLICDICENNYNLNNDSTKCLIASCVNQSYYLNTNNYTCELCSVSISNCLTCDGNYSNLTCNEC